MMQFLRFWFPSLGICFLCVAPPAVGQYQEIDALAAKIAEPLSQAPRTTAAVVDFTDLQGNATELGRFIAEELSSSLFATGRVQMIDRTHLKALLKELKIDSTGITDPATRRELRVRGVRLLITGTITPFGDSIRCVVKAIDSETAQVEAISAGEIPRTKTIEELLSKNVPGVATPGTSDSATHAPSLSVGQSNTRNATSALPVPVQPVQIFQRESHQFSFVLTSCKQTGDVLVCRLQITNQAQDRRLGLATRWAALATRIVDASGREYISDLVQVGAAHNNIVYKTLVTGVPMAAALRFSNIAVRLTLLRLVEIACVGVDRRDLTIQFRDVPVN